METQTIQQITDNKEIILMVGAAIVEVLLRVVPTKKNFSMLHGVLKLIDVLIPNRYKHDDGMNIEKGTFEIGKITKQ